MTIELHALRRVRLRAESSFATDMTSGGTSFTSFLDVPALESGVNVVLEEQENPVQTVQQYVDGAEESIFGLRPWSFTFTIPLHATGVVANSSTSSVTSAMGKILTQAMGAESLSSGTVVASGGSSTGATVTGGQGSRVPVGTAIACATGTGGAFECREILSLSTDTIGLKMAASATLSGALLRSATYYMTEPSEAPTTLQFVIEGVELDDRFVLLGGRCTLGFGFSWGQVPTLQVTVRGNYWFRYTSSDAIAAASLSNFAPIILSGSELHVATVGSTTQALQSPCSAFTMSLNTGWIGLRTPGGIQTEYGVRRSRNVPVASGSFTIPYQDDSWWDSMEAYEDRAVFFQIGNSISGSKGAGALLISCPTVQITNVQRVDGNGIASQQVSWKARTDSSVTPTNSLQRSAVRIHVF